MITPCLLVHLLEMVWYTSMLITWLLLGWSFSHGHCQEACFDVKDLNHLYWFYSFEVTIIIMVICCLSRLCLLGRRLFCSNPYSASLEVSSQWWGVVAWCYPLLIACWQLFLSYHLWVHVVSKFVFGSQIAHYSVVLHIVLYLQCTFSHMLLLRCWLNRLCCTLSFVHMLMYFS